MAYKYTFKGIGFDELPGSPTVDFDEAGAFNGRRTIVCAWEDRIDLAHGFLGFGFPGDRAGRFPGSNRAKIKSIAVAPHSSIIVPDTTLMMNGYEEALLSLTYKESEPLEGEVEGTDGEILDETIETTAEMIPQTWRKLYWDEYNNENPELNQPVTEGEGPVIPVVTRKWTVRLGNVSELPPGVVNMKPYTNDGPITSISLGETFATGTVLFIGSTQSHIFTKWGASPWTLQLNFMVRAQQPWNTFYKRGSDTPAPMFMMDGSQYEIATPASFPQMFRMPLAG